MWLHAGDEDRQLSTLTAPAASHRHPQGLVGLFRHVDLLLLTGYALRQVLRRAPERTHQGSGSSNIYRVIMLQ